MIVFVANIPAARSYLVIFSYIYCILPYIFKNCYVLFNHLTEGQKQSDGRTKLTMYCKTDYFMR